MAYGDFKFLTRGTAYNKILRDKAFNIAKNLALMVFTFLIKKTSGSGIKNENKSEQQLAEELHQAIIEKFKKRQIQSPFMKYICRADHADMQ